MIERKNLSYHVRLQIRDRIVCGAMEPGRRINEVHLAQELGVSRTPLREALSGLVLESFVVEVPRRGFFVSQLSVDEIRQLYAIRQILDPSALKLAGIPNQATLDELGQLNRKMARARKASLVVELDDQWHLMLVGGCANRILLGLIEQHMVRTRRYEFAYMSQAKNTGVAVDEHEQILSALGDRKLALACKKLKQNMSSAEGPLVDWVRTQERYAGEKY